MRKCAVMQPSYLPWLGFFNLILNSDVFIFLDDVQYSKNTFFNRNRYSSKAADGFSWLTVPVKKGRLGQLISESSLVEEERWRKKHLTTMQIVFGKSLFFKQVFPILEKEILNESNNTLSKLNISLVRSICKYLSIEREFYISSELNVAGGRSERLLKMCEMFECDIYLSPRGAEDYLTDDEILPSSCVKIFYQDYYCKEYKQTSCSDFISGMSIIDILFNYSRDEIIDIIFQEVTK